jgi:hypothetical protein
MRGSLEAVAGDPAGLFFIKKYGIIYMVEKIV